MGLFSSGTDPSVAARQEEQRRKAEIAAGQRRIEGIFSGPEREQQIQDFIDAQRGLLFSDLNREHEDTGRQLKFSLARSGLSEATGSLAPAISSVNSARLGGLNNLLDMLPRVLRRCSG